MKIVVGGIKGGTGKSTIAFHIATHAFLQGKKIATFDCDGPQYSFTRYYENRMKNKTLKTWEAHHKINDFNFPKFNNDIINIIDTPGRFDENIVKVHADADIIITPINDSFVDVDTIMKIENEKWTMPNAYYEAIFENKKNKPNSLWILVRNRSSSINSKNKKNIEEKLLDLSKRMGFTIANGLKERVIFKEHFTTGKTIMDLKNKLPISHIAAKMEIKLLWKLIQNYIDKNTICEK